MSNRRKLGQVYKFAGASALASSGEISSVDTATRQATAVISTPSPDRVRDAVNPMGCNLDEYRTNPVVYWEHGKVLTLPIGTSENPNSKELAVTKSPGGVVATCWFTDKFLEAEQIFELVAERIIRAASVRFTPITKPSRRKDATYFDEWNLLEWSWVGIGCNPEAVAETVSRGRLAGKPIVEPIAKSLQLYIPKRKVLVPGSAVKKTMDPETTEKPEDTKQQESAYGDQLLRAVYKALSDLYSNLESGMGKLEHPGVKEALQAVMENLGQVRAAMEGAYSEHYKGSPGLCSECSEPDEEAMKSFLSLGLFDRYELIGVADRIKALSASRNLDRLQKESLAVAGRTLSRLFEKGKQKSIEKHEPPKVEKSEIPSKELSELLGEVKSFVGAIKGIMP